MITAIATLDGSGEIELYHPGVAWLGVAGGPWRFFVGCSLDEDGTIQQVRNMDPLEGGAEFVVGGQPTTLASNYLIPLEVATAAALYFLRKGAADPSITWDRM